MPWLSPPVTAASGPEGPQQWGGLSAELGVGSRGAGPMLAQNLQFTRVCSPVRGMLARLLTSWQAGKTLGVGVAPPGGRGSPVVGAPRPPQQRDMGGGSEETPII